MKHVRALVGLGLVGYGLLVVLQVVAHEALVAGLLSLAAGAFLLFRGLPGLQVRQGKLVAGLGVVCIVGVAGYNLLARSGLGIPEWGILLYGLALLWAAPRLEQEVRSTDIGTLVGWSFPLLLAPLAMFAMNAAITAGSADTAGAPIVHALVVWPSAFLLQAVGTPLTVDGNSFIVGTPRGTMVLGVGLVCAGLYPMVLFSGLVALHGWQRKLPGKVTAAYLAAGLLGLWFLNLIRLTILTKVGQRWGMDALTTVHAHIGWVLFALFVVGFWGIVLHHVERPTPAA